MAKDSSKPRVVTAEQYARLEAWSQRKPCVSLMGEFSAGKSTLLNFLIEEEMLPTRATATELPPVWFSHGSGGSHWVDGDGSIHALDLNALHTVPMSARYVRLYAPAEILEHCDVVDTPGISDPNLAVESWRFAVGVSNMVLWCSSATQVWRQSERSAWTSLPERLQKHSLLIVTRADKLTTEVDRDKVDRRLARETSDLFHDRVFLSTPNAVQAKAELVENESSPLWESSGAAALLDRLAERFEAIYEERAALLSRYKVSDPESDVKPRPVRPVATPGPIKPLEPEPAVEEQTAEAAVAAERAPAEESAPVAAPPEPDEVAAAADTQEVAETPEPEVVEPQPQDDIAPESEPVAEEDAPADVAKDDSADAAAFSPYRPARVESDAPRSSRPSAAEADELMARMKVDLDKPVETAPAAEAEEVPVDRDADTVSAVGNLMAMEAEAVDSDPTEEAEADQPEEVSVHEGEPDDVPAAELTEDVSDQDMHPGTDEEPAQEEMSVEETPVSQPDQPADALPREVAIWRQIVARTSVRPENEQVVAMIEQLLIEMASGDEHEAAVTPERAGDDAPTDEGSAADSGWRRLA